MHSLPEDGRRRKLSRPGKKNNELKALTNWRSYIGRLVRILKETNQVRGTHRLEIASRTCRYMERKQQCQAYSLSGDSDGLISIQKETD